MLKHVLIAIVAIPLEDRDKSEANPSPLVMTIDWFHMLERLPRQCHKRYQTRHHKFFFRSHYYLSGLDMPFYCVGCNTQSFNALNENRCFLLAQGRWTWWRTLLMSLLTCFLRPVVTLKLIVTPLWKNMVMKLTEKMMMLYRASTIVLRHVMLLSSMDTSFGMMLKMRRNVRFIEHHIVMMMMRCKNTRSPVCLMSRAMNWWMRWRRTGGSGKLAWHRDCVWGNFLFLNHTGLASRTFIQNNHSLV